MSKNRPKKRWLRSLSFIFYLLSFILLAACSGLIKLEMPPENVIADEQSWLMLGRNVQHHHTSPKNISPPLDIVWRRGVKSVVADHPLAFGDYIFAPTLSGAMYMIDYETGERLGDGKIAPALSNAPSIAGTRMYAGGAIGGKTLVGFRLDKANTFMKERYPHINTAPLIVGEQLFFGTYSGEFFSASIGTGEKIWEFKARSPVRSSPASSGNSVYFADDKGWVYALEKSAGIKQWEAQLNGNIYSHPVVDDSSLYIGTTEGFLYALDLKNGKTRWQIRLKGSIFGSPSLYGNTLYIGNNAHEVCAIDKSTGEIGWTFKTNGIVNSVPLPSPDYLYIASWDKHLYVLNRFSGEMIYKVEFSKPLKSSPIIYRDYILVQTANDKLYALANEKFIAELKERK